MEPDLWAAAAARHASRVGPPTTASPAAGFATPAVPPGSPVPAAATVQPATKRARPSPAAGGPSHDPLGQAFGKPAGRAAGAAPNTPSRVPIVSPPAVVDVEDGDLPTSQGSLKKSRTVPPSPSQVLNEAPDLADVNPDDVLELCLAECRTMIVGIRYYNGIVSNGECVTLQREPTNPYDANAVRVLNVLGEQVGHIRREDAAQLSPLLAAAGTMSVRIDGWVQNKTSDPYKIPLEIAAYGPESARSVVESALRRFENAKVGKQIKDNGNMGAGRTAKQQGMSTDTILSNLDLLFEAETNVDTMEAVPTPAGMRSQLMPHQRKALWWMTMRETELTVEDMLARQEATAARLRAAAGTSGKAAAAAKAYTPQALMWQRREQNGQVQYVNTFTQFVVKKPPPLPAGGILADDMGLGKTITTIALMLAHRLPGPTLIVAPMSVMNVWVDQITQHTEPGTLKVYLYHGTERTRDAAELSGYDVVVTSYALLAQEAGNPSRETAMTRVEWGRVVLDEAHIVKNRETKLAKGAWRLNAASHWCLTGTPIQNRLNDLYPLFKFIGVQPLTTWDWWKRLIMQPILSRHPDGFLHLQHLLKCLCLRRTKTMTINGQPIIKLPPRIVNVMRVTMSESQAATYRETVERCRKVIHELENKNELKGNYAFVLVLLLRLRQLACDSALVPDDFFEFLQQAVTAGGNPLRMTNPKLLAQVVELLDDGSNPTECCICMDNMTQPAITPCAHTFCTECLTQHLQTAQTCPMCRSAVKLTEVLSLETARKMVQDLAAGAQQTAEQPDTTQRVGYGCKIEALLKEVNRLVLHPQSDMEDSKGDTEHRDAKDAADDDDSPPRKCIVFSQFTTLLDGIAHRLTAQGVKYVVLTGNCTARQRAESIRLFQSDPSVQIFLISLHAGGVGLTLTAANRVFVMDPWWNPAAEDQAIDRVHRVGQTLPVYVHRIITSDTVEERILELQEQKRLVATGAFKKMSSQEATQLPVEQLRIMFT